MHKAMDSVPRQTPDTHPIHNQQQTPTSENQIDLLLPYVTVCTLQARTERAVSEFKATGLHGECNNRLPNSWGLS